MGLTVRRKAVPSSTAAGAEGRGCIDLAGRRRPLAAERAGTPRRPRAPKGGRGDSQSEARVELPARAGGGGGGGGAVALR